MDRLNVGVLGVGAAGMEFIRGLDRHPYFQITGLYGNSTAGARLEEVVDIEQGMLEETRSIKIKRIGELGSGLDLVCSALPSDAARQIEAECAKHTPVISTSSAYRYEPDVPIIITELNAEHYRILELQRERGWAGWILPGPNCTTVGLAMSLFPLYREFGIKKVVMSSYQAVSGAGKEKLDLWSNQRTSGLPFPINGTADGLVIEGNAIPFIAQEESKVRTETLKVLGGYAGNGLVPANFGIDCICVRIPVYAGHLESVFVDTEREATVPQVIEAYSRFNIQSFDKFGSLPSSPLNVITLDYDVPQPRLHANLDGGMTAVVGRLDQTGSGLKYVVLSNNLQRGAAKGIILAAEYLYNTGFLKRK